MQCFRSDLCRCTRWPNQRVAYTCAPMILEICVVQHDVGNCTHLVVPTLTPTKQTLHRLRALTALPASTVPTTMAMYGESHKPPFLGIVVAVLSAGSSKRCTTLTGCGCGCGAGGGHGIRRVTERLRRSWQYVPGTSDFRKSAAFSLPSPRHLPCIGGMLAM